MSIIDKLDFSKSPDGLIPAVAQDAESKDVLMVAYVNREALKKTLELGEAVYYSRSRKELWHKGATSGHVQKIRDILIDCDEDCIIYLVIQSGGACHTGSRSCFFRHIENGEIKQVK